MRTQVRSIDLTAAASLSVRGAIAIAQPDNPPTATLPYVGAPVACRCSILDGWINATTGKQETSGGLIYPAAQ